MVSLRFPFLFSQPTPKRPPTSSSLGLPATVAFAATAAAAAAGAAAYTARQHPFLQGTLGFLLPSHSPSSLPWGSLSLADGSPPVVESKTGFSFPSVLAGSRKLLGTGLRRKSVFGLKNIDVYAFGVYADHSDVKKLLKEKNGELSTSDLMESDICMTVRLQIVYGKLSIRSVRTAFEESVGSRLQKFGVGDNKELLQSYGHLLWQLIFGAIYDYLFSTAFIYDLFGRFTSQFKDEIKIPRGSVIDLSRDRGHVLRTIIDGKEVGSIESKLLCRSLLDLYIGEDPFDKQAKEDVKLNLASLLQ